MKRKLILIRHAKAWEREDWAKESDNDNLRPLTSPGASRFQKAFSESSFSHLPIDWIVTSKLLRGIQTGEICRQVTSGTEVIQVDWLGESSDLDQMEEFLRATSGNGIIVGHNPSLGFILNRLVGVGGLPIIEFKKGQLCLLSQVGDVFKIKEVMSLGFFEKRGR